MLLAGALVVAVEALVVEVVGATVVADPAEVVVVVLVAAWLINATSDAGLVGLVPFGNTAMLISSSFENL